MTTERDLQNQFAYARKQGLALGLEEGRAKGLAEGRAEGRATGIKEGREEERMIVASRMLKAGMDILQIAELTKLDVDYIKALQDKA